MKKRRAKALSQPRSTAQTQPFIAHLHELRRRLYIIAACILVGGSLAYGVEHQIVAALLRPAGRQQFIYTSVGGGMDFLFKVCLYAGIVVSIPVIVYHVLKFIEPLLKEASHSFITKMAVISALLALIGMVFGYYVGLPNALYFLSHQFTTAQIRPLVTIQAYMSFVSVYMVGSALLLQTPLILLLINRITPLKPGGLMRHERWVILGAFVGAFLMNPTPNMLAQAMVIVPIIIAYHIGVALVWLANRKGKRPAHVLRLLEQDMAVQQERLQRIEAAIGLSTSQFAFQPEPIISADLPIEPVVSPPEPPALAPVPTSAPGRAFDIMPRRPINPRYINRRIA